MSVVETSAIQKTPNVCGGEACIRRTRIAVWMVVEAWRLGQTDAGLLEDYPGLSQADLDACWEYYREHLIEIEQVIWYNGAAAMLPEGVPPPAWIIISGRLLGLTDEQIMRAFYPPLSSADPDHAGIVIFTDDKSDRPGVAARIDAALAAVSSLAKHLIRVNLPNTPPPPVP